MERSFKDLVIKMIRQISQESEYQKEPDGFLTVPLILTSIKVNYLEIGNGVELDSFIMSFDKIYCAIHIRNVKEVYPTILLDTLKTLTEWILKEVVNTGYSIEEFMELLPDDYSLMVGRLDFDPGVSGHMNHEPKFGVRLSSVGIFHNETEIESIQGAFEKIDLRSLLNNPGIYPNNIILSPVAIDKINELLKNLDGQKNILTRLRYNLSILLKKGGKGKVKTDLGEVPFKWNYVGDTPHLEFEFDHSYNRKIVGAVRYNDLSGGKNTFVIHLPNEIENSENESLVRSLVDDKLFELFSKNQIHINIGNRGHQYHYDL